MNIGLLTNELLTDIRNKSHEECANTISDVEARYRTEAGNHKNEEVYRCMLEAASTLSHIVGRYLNDTAGFEADDSANIPDAFVYDLNFSERRMQGKAQAMADAMHSYIVHYTLSRYYITVAAPDLAKTHTELATAAATLVQRLMYTKKPPLI